VQQNSFGGKQAAGTKQAEESKQTEELNPKDAEPISNLNNRNIVPEEKADGYSDIITEENKEK
jgi:hypothetical protein